MLKKKIISAVMAAAVLAAPICTLSDTVAHMNTVSAASSGISATSGNCGKNVRWIFSRDTGTLTISGSGDMNDFEYSSRCIANPPTDAPWYNLRDLIKKVVITGRVTSVGAHAFEKYKNLESAVLPDSIKTIGKYAFMQCKKLKEITIPKGISTIEEYTFEGCECLKSVTIPSNVKVVREHSFEYCTNITELVIEEGVTELFDQSFSRCDSLTSVYIPASVENFTYAFSGSESMKEINVSEDNLFWSSIDGVVFSKDKTKLWEYPAGRKEKTYSVPEGVKFIGCSVFSSDKYLEEVKLPKSVTYLTGNAFCDMDSLKNVTVPEHVMSIGHSTFYECNDLETITILNPKCDIYDNRSTISNCQVEGEYGGSNPSFSGTIIGYEGSTAQAYAKKYRYKFKSLGKYKDNGEYKLELYNFTAEFLKSCLQELSDETLDEMDVNSDGKINVFDLLIMKRSITNK